MERYKKQGGNTGVSAFEVGDEFIKIRFIDSPRIYTYSYRSAGVTHVEIMKDLAQKGSGLNTYINKYVKDLYD